MDRRIRRRFACNRLLGAALLVLAGCSSVPLPAPMDPSGTPPTLLPLDSLLARVDAAAPRDPAPGLAARAARLKARAALMRGPVLDPATRARLVEAIRAGRA